MGGTEPLRMTGALAGTAGDAQAIIDNALASAEPTKIPDPSDGMLAYVVPYGASLEVLDLEHHLNAPRRAKGTVTVATVASLTSYIQKHEPVASDAVSIWVHPTSGAIVAILNDHGDDQVPGWGDHRAKLTLIVPDEWKRWVALDGDLVDQEEFAEHIQDGLAEIAHPAGADLLELAQTMRGTVNAEWRSGVSIHDGAVQMQYVEEAQASAGRSGDMTIPTEFDLVIAPFVGEPPTRLTARLRWRVKGGDLKLGYRLDNPSKVVRDALESIANRLSDTFPDRVYLGEPRS